MMNPNASWRNVLRVVRDGRVPGRVDERELPRGSAVREELVPPAGQQPQDEHEGENRTRDLDDELDEVGPDDCLHPAEEGVDDRDDAHDHDGRFHAPADVLQ